MYLKLQELKKSKKQLKVQVNDYKKQLAEKEEKYENELKHQLAEWKAITERNYKLQLLLETMKTENMERLKLSNIVNLRQELETYVKMERLRLHGKGHHALSLETVFKEKGKDLERESDSLREAFSKRLFENPSELVFFFELFGVRCSMWPNVEGVDQQRVLKLLNPRPKLASRQVPLPNGPPMAFSQLLQSHLQRDKWEVFLKQTASAEGGPREKFLETTRDLIREHMPRVSSEPSAHLQVQSLEQLAAVVAVIGRLLAYCAECASQEVHMRYTHAGLTFLIFESEIRDLLARHVLLESLLSRNERAEIVPLRSAAAKSN